MSCRHNLEVRHHRASMDDNTAATLMPSANAGVNPASAAAHFAAMYGGGIGGGGGGGGGVANAGAHAMSTYQKILAVAAAMTQTWQTQRRPRSMAPTTVLRTMLSLVAAAAAAAAVVTAMLVAPWVRPPLPQAELA